MMKVDRPMDIELEQTSIYILMSVFAAQVHSEVISDERFLTVVHQDEDYFLLANRISDSQMIYDVSIWRTCGFEDRHGVLFSVAHFPGVLGASYRYEEWQSIPVNQSGTRSVYGPMHGVTATFAYPEDDYELSSFNNRALDTY